MLLRTWVWSVAQDGSGRLRRLGTAGRLGTALKRDFASVACFVFVVFVASVAVGAGRLAPAPLAPWAQSRPFAKPLAACWFHKLCWLWTLWGPRRRGPGRLR